MQDPGLIPNGGRFFGGDRRLRPFPSQAVKCPRCDSLNTKFCYYNNYNLSQPRHFCKSCRRYWTKGGVLRNVPVGGGCRKAKRSKTKSSSSSSDHLIERKTSSNSSSDNSSLTATTAIGNEAAVCSTNLLNNFPDSRLFLNQTPPENTNFNTSVLENLDQGSAGGIFAEGGSFTSLMNVGNAFNFTDISPFRLNSHQQQQESELQEQQEQQKMSIEEMKMQELTAGLDLSELQNITGNSNNGELDWHSSQGLFDFPSTLVDQGYWGQWTQTDQHLYLP